MLRNSKAVCFLLLFCFNAMADQTPAYHYKLLKDSRQSITIPTYSLEDKKTVIDQAYLVMSEIYVHRSLKLQNHGVESDPLPMLKKLEAKIENISERDFHNELINIFAHQQDLHTRYFLPKPYACYRSYLPFTFREVTDLTGQKSIVVNKTLETPEIMKLIPDSGVSVGDALVKYDGLSAYEAIKEREFLSAGANSDAKKKYAINLLSLISQRLHFLPEKNTVQLEFKDRSGNIYSTNVPWITREDINCLRPQTNTPEYLARNDYQQDFNFIYRKATGINKNKNKLTDELKSSNEPTLKYKIIKNEFGDFGYIQLESFVPEKLTTQETVTELKHILTERFSKTTALIIDIRNNGGGYLLLAESLIQLFTPKKIQPTLFRFRNTPAIRHLYENWSIKFLHVPELIEEAQANNAEFTRAIPLSPEYWLEDVGQHYHKPVAVFTNSNCYSACDIFSAVMQDHEAATIFGEDSTTGAGGATVHSHTQWLDILKENPGPFKRLPGDQNISFAFQQSLRTGKSEGVFIEGRGVLSDRLVQPKISDIYNDDADQFKIISQALQQASSP